MEERRSAHGGEREERVPVGTGHSSWMTAVKKMTGALVNGFGTDLPDARKVLAGEAVALLGLYTLALSLSLSHTHTYTHTMQQGG